jgi:hypothetical protein
VDSTCFGDNDRRRDGWGVIRAVMRAKTMRNLRKLFGDKWAEEEVLCPEPEHLLGKWRRKRPENPVTKYTDELVGIALQADALKCDLSRLASKLKGEFVDTLTELGYAVFLTKQGFQLVMEPTAPEAVGPVAHFPKRCTTCCTFAFKF